MPRRRRSLLFQYRLLFAALFPLLAAHALFMALRHRDGRYLRQRLGFFGRTDVTGAVWLHAASVGEVNALLPLIAELRRRHPQLPLLLTTATPTGAAVAARRLPELPHAYLPLDRHAAVRRFLAAYQPCCGLIMETELWPNLFAACGEQSLPLFIINGRLSARTLGAPVWLRDLYAGCLAQVRAVLARSEADRLGFIRLGMHPDGVQGVGNIKFALPEAQPEPLELGRPYVLAASTRDGEEAKLLEAWRRRPRSELLVIAPRHPQRLPAILRVLKEIPHAVRSRSEQPGPQTAVYVADTFGELARFMAGAELVFMGGSLVPKGGHNLLEPAALGRPVLFGPHMENFADEARLLLAEGGARQAADPGELAGLFDELLAAPEIAREMGQRARETVAARRDMAQRYAQALETLGAFGGAAVDTRV